MDSDLVLVIVVATALAFDFTNGFHDTANAIATSISTRAMSPRVAVADVGGPELRRRVHLAEGRGDGRPGHRRRRRGHADRRLRRPDRRDRLEPRDVVVRPAVELLARADRRPGRRGVRGRAAPSVDRRRRHRREGHRPRADRADARLRRRRASRSSSSTGSSAGCGRARSTAATGSGSSSPGSLFSLAHGTNDAQKTMGIITLALIAHGNLAGQRLPRPDLGRRVLGDRRSRSAPTPAAGGSSARWARRIIKMDPAQGFSRAGRGRRGRARRLAPRLPAVDHARDLAAA